MRKAIVHIGPHKTGTTYLQACFARRRNELLNRGILAPVEWEHAANNASHSKLAAALSDGNDMSAMERIVQAAFASAGTLLISSEDLCNIDKHGVRRLSLLLRGCSVTIIYYVRRWSDRLPSLWQELVRQGRSWTFPEYLADQLRNPEASRLFNFSPQLAEFIEIFGADSVKLVRYSVLRDREDDLFTHFAKHFLDWANAEAPLLEADMNRSRDPAPTELLRALNAIETLTGDPPSAALRQRLDSAWSGLDLAGLLAAMDRQQRALVINDGTPILNRFHRELFERHKSNVVHPGPPDLFFRPKKRKISYISTDYLLSAPVVTQILHLHRLLSKT